MKYPEFLKSNGTIGFVAPSFGCATEPYKSAFVNAQKKFEEAGFNLDLGPNVYKAEGIGISNTPELCGRELTEMYLSSDNDVLISVGGGELMCEDLEYVDFGRIKQAEPKWYMGYSDNTNFTFLQTTMCDTAAIYGPCAATFGMEPWHKALYDACEVLSGKREEVSSYDGWEKESRKDEEHPTAAYNITEPNVVKCFTTENSDGRGQAEFRGRLVGGCMDCLVNLLGTKYDKVDEFNEQYKEDGIIWFIESCDLNVMAIRRAMWQMDNAGWFKHVKGFIIGRPCVYGQEMMGLDHYEAVLGIIRKHNVPVIMDADIGHIAPSMPIVSGSVANVLASDNKLTIKYTFC